MEWREIDNWADLTVAFEALSLFVTIRTVEILTVARIATIPIVGFTASAEIALSHTVRILTIADFRQSVLRHARFHTVDSGALHEFRQFPPALSCLLSFSYQAMFKSVKLKPNRKGGNPHWQTSRYRKVLRNAHYIRHPCPSCGTACSPAALEGGKGVLCPRRVRTPTY